MKTSCLKVLKRTVPAMVLSAPLLFSAPFFLSASSAEYSPLPAFPDGYDQANSPVSQILQDYREGRFLDALVQVKQLQGELPEGPLAEAIAFLLGDIYFNLAREGQTQYLDKALSAFHTATLTYPDSENAVRGLWRMGQVYRHMELYYESIASFKRVLKNHPESPFADRSPGEIAQTYRAWKKWGQAARAFRAVHLEPLSGEEQRDVLTGYADSLYHLGAYAKAYQLYEKVSSRWPQDARQDMAALFQHADAAYRTDHRDQADRLFLYLFNVYPRTEPAPTALFRVGDSLRQKQNNQQAQDIYAQVAALYPESFAARLSRLVKATADLHCVTRPPKPLGTQDTACPQSQEEAARTLSDITGEIRENARHLIQADLQAAVLDETLLASAGQLKDYGFFEEALEILHGLSGRPMPISLRKKVLGVLQETMAEALQHRLEHGENIRMIELAHSYPSALTPHSLLGDTGLILAEAYLRLDLPQQAVRLLEAVAADPRNPLAEEAQYKIGRALLQQGELAQARQTFSRFLSKHPKSRWRPEVSEALGQTFSRLGENDRAIPIYQSWLARYREHPRRQQVYLQLAQAYMQSQQPGQAAPIYLKLASRHPEQSAQFYLKTGDAYYQIREYGKALKFYNRALKGPVGPQDAEWAKFQLANSHLALGQLPEGQTILRELSQSASDPLIQQMASQRNREFQEEASRAGG